MTKVDGVYLAISGIHKYLFRGESMIEEALQISNETHRATAMERPPSFIPLHNSPRNHIQYGDTLSGENSSGSITISEASSSHTLPNFGRVQRLDASESVYLSSRIDALMQSPID